MTKIVLYFLINILALLILSNFLPSFNVMGIWPAASFVIVLSILNMFVVPIIKFFTFPINFLTLGLFYGLINLLAISFTASVVKGIEISGSTLTTIFTILIISFSLCLAQSLVGAFSEK